MQQVKSLDCFAAKLRQQMLTPAEWDTGEHSAPETAFPEVEKQTSTADNNRDRKFNELALELFSLQFEHNCAYRKLCETRELRPSRIRHWSEIPELPTAAFKELDLSCIPETQRTTVFCSSGTTSHRPSRHFHNLSSLEIYETSLLAWFDCHLLGQTPVAKRESKPPIGLDNHQRGFVGTILALTPTPLQAPHSSLVHMFETVQRRLSNTGFFFVGTCGRDGAWKVDYAEVIARLHEAAKRGEAVMLLGTAFGYVHLLDHLSERNLKFQLPAGSRVLETGGYKGRSRVLAKSQLHGLITRLLGVPAAQVICEYGMSELSSQAYDRVVCSLHAFSTPGTRDVPVRSAPEATRGLKTSEPHRVFHALRAGTSRAPPRVFRFPPWAKVQIISPETGREVQEGETGLIRVFDLANVYSVMALQTEDLAVRRGDGFELIGRAELAEPRGCSLMAQ